MTVEQKEQPGQEQQQGEQEQGQQQGQQQENALTFDKWLTSQPDNIKDLLDDHTSGLKTALTEERRERKILSDKLKALGGAAEKGSELKRQLDDISGQMAATDAKATFYEDAHEAGVKNLRSAWALAKEYGLISDKGVVDLARLKEVAPEQFAVKVPPRLNGGDGANQSGNMGKPNMNQAIRTMAGRG